MNLDPTTGTLTSIVRNGEEFPLEQNFFYYESFAGDNVDPDSRSSGAYVFRPAKQEPTLIEDTAYFETYKGKCQ